MLMQRTRSKPAATAATSSGVVSGLKARPTPSPCARAAAETSSRSRHASWWIVTLSPPACATASKWRSGASTIRWQSTAPPRAWMRGAIDSITIGPIVTGGTKCPSPTSKWKMRVPASSSASICAPRFQKSAAYSDGATSTARTWLVQLTLEPGSGGTVDDRTGRSAPRTHQARRRRRTWCTRQCSHQRRRFLRPDREEDDVRGFRESLGRERDALHARVEPGLRGDCAPGARGEGGGIREQGGSVSVGADAEQDEAEGDPAKITVVLGGCAFGSQFDANPVDGGGWTGETGEQRLLHEPEVRPLVVGRDTAFVPPPDLCLAPVAVLERSELVGAARRRPAREDDVLTGVRRIGQQSRRARCCVLWIGGNDEFDAHVCTVFGCGPDVSSGRVTTRYRSGTA